jgi:hypothetical protein
MSWSRHVGSNIKTIVQTLKLHQSHQEITGFTSQYARTATRAAAGLIGGSAAQAAFDIHRAANAAKNALLLGTTFPVAPPSCDRCDPLLHSDPWQGALFVPSPPPLHDIVPENDPPCRHYKPFGTHVASTLPEKPRASYEFLAAVPVPLEGLQSVEARLATVEVACSRILCLIGRVMVDLVPNALAEPTAVASNESLKEGTSTKEGSTPNTPPKKVIEAVEERHRDQRAAQRAHRDHQADFKWHRGQRASEGGHRHQKAV